MTPAKRRIRSTILRIGLALPLLAVMSAEATAIPAFARKYRVSCQLCHNPVPTLNEFGSTFAGNGFRFAAEEPPRDTIDTGDPLLELAKDLPLALRFDLYGVAVTDGQSGADFQTPYNVKILTGGTISRKLSYYLYFFLFERGEVGGIEDAYIYWNDIGDAPIDLVLGQFQVSDPMFKRELRLEYDDYAVYRARIGDVPADLTYDRGVMGIFTPGTFTISGTVVNGNGKGEAEPNRLLDDDLLKNWFTHVTSPIGSNLRLGVMGYYGRQDGEAPGGPQLTNDLWMLGADATLTLNRFEINAQYIHREDDNPTFTTDEPSVTTDGGFAEVIYRFRNGRWYALGLWNYIECSEPLLDVSLGGPADVNRYHTLSGGAGYVLRRNFRLLGELGWNFEQDEARAILGFVTAF